MAEDSWKIKNNLCRCCHAEGEFFDLSKTRPGLEGREDYAFMLIDCFNLYVPQVCGTLYKPTYTICEPCIAKLREAAIFKKTVQSCEDKFMDMFKKNVIVIVKDAMTDAKEAAADSDYGDITDDEENDEDTGHEEISDVQENVTDTVNTDITYFQGNDTQSDGIMFWSFVTTIRGGSGFPKISSLEDAKVSDVTIADNVEISYVQENDADTGHEGITDVQEKESVEEEITDVGDVDKPSFKRETRTESMRRRLAKNKDQITNKDPAKKVITKSYKKSDPAKKTPPKSDKKNDPAKSNKKNDPAKSDKKTDPAKCDKKSDPAKPDEKTDPAKCDKKSDPAKSDEKTDPAKSDKKCDPAKPDKKSDRTKSDKKTDPAKSDKKTDLPKSDKKADAGKSDKKTDLVKEDRPKSKRRPNPGKGIRARSERIKYPTLKVKNSVKKNVPSLKKLEIKKSDKKNNPAKDDKKKENVKSGKRRNAKIDNKKIPAQNVPKKPNKKKVPGLIPLAKYKTKTGATPKVPANTDKRVPTKRAYTKSNENSVPAKKPRPNSILADKDEESVEVAEGEETIVKSVVKGVGSDRKFYLQPSDYTTAPDGSSYTCTHCHQPFTAFYSLRQHIRYHYKLSKFLCPLCPEQFKNEVPFTLHKLKAHDIDERFHCKLCKKVFNKKPLLEYHQDVVHKMGEKVKCPDCTFISYHRLSLRKHSKKHTGNLKCKYCQKPFYLEDTLKFHERIHRGDKRKVCQVCGKAFVQRASLSFHMRKYHPGYTPQDI